MRIVKSVTVGDREVIVKELDVSDIRGWIKLMSEEAEPDFVGDTLLPDISLKELCLMIDIEYKEMDSLTQSDLINVCDVAREINPLFFATLGKAKNLLEETVTQQGTKPQH